MLNRRECLLGTIGAGIVALGGDCIAAPEMEPIRVALKRTVGMRGKVAGAVAVVIDEGDTSSVSYGSSGAPHVAWDAHTVFEIGSITKVMTALMLADMAARGEVAVGDPVSKYLPLRGRFMSMGGRSRFLTLPATVQACRDGLEISRRTGGTIRIHLPITRPISSMSLSRATCRHTNRLRISHTPVSGTDC